MKNCVYCGDYASTKDHFVPWSFNNAPGKRKSQFALAGTELLDSCVECNSMASNNVFDTIEQKREFIQEKIERKYSKILKIPDWSENDLNELSSRLRKNTRLKILAKHWILNRIAYPGVVYPEEPIRKEWKKIQQLF